MTLFKALILLLIPSKGPLVSFNPSYFQFNLTENISYSSIDFNDIAIKVNDKDTSADFSKYEVMIGPFKTGEEVSIETIVNAIGKQLTDVHRLLILNKKILY